MKRSLRFPGKRSFQFVSVLGVVLTLIILFGIGGFSVAASQEARDAFCASCHSQPETAYYQRSIGLSAVDLASYHTSQGTRCIDCHSGPGIIGRVQAESLGARNASLWFSGKAVQPAQRTFPISDANCLKCHADIAQKGFVSKEQISTAHLQNNGDDLGNDDLGGKGHYHQHLARWQAKAPGSAGSCVTCHTGHGSSGSASSGFMDIPSVRNTCDACHQVLWGEEEK